MKSVEGMKVAASRLARGVVSSANPGIYSKTYTEEPDPFKHSFTVSMITVSISSDPLDSLTHPLQNGIIRS